MVVTDPRMVRLSIADRILAAGELRPLEVLNRYQVDRLLKYLWFRALLPDYTDRQTITRGARILTAAPDASSSVKHWGTEVSDAEVAATEAYLELVDAFKDRPAELEPPR